MIITDLDESPIWLGGSSTSMQIAHVKGGGRFSDGRATGDKKRSSALLTVSCNLRIKLKNEVTLEAYARKWQRDQSNFKNPPLPTIDDFHFVYEKGPDEGFENKLNQRDDSFEFFS